ncbi:serpin-Z2-like [Eutrema salsugineum]|uniref:serpin-Z2-like n=1 Tax=Eutrema salsugineum TaxID=72664 RepID=UPI000CED53EC|nr:serpin-Z2-like [Eutrema salsugineum]
MSWRVQVGEFRIPKFKISFGFEASRVFKRLGWDEDEMALYRKACVEIDEEGAEAAAAAAICVPVSLTNYKVDFVVDHPFLFLIREDTTRTVLFAGQIFDPSISS